MRFGEFDDNYQKCKLIDKCKIVTRTNERNSKYPIMMISAGKGFIDQSEKYSRDNAGTSLDKYILLKKGELAYNRGNSKQFPYGAIYEMKEKSALIPYVYHCFRIFDASTRYFSYYLNSPFKNKQLSKIITSSVRGNGLLNISKSDFFNLSLRIPSVEEQVKIARFLNLIEDRISTQIKIISTYELLINGLCEQLITSKTSNTKIEKCLNCNTSNIKESDLDNINVGDYPVYGANGYIKSIDEYQTSERSIGIIKDGAGVGRLMKLKGKYSVIGTLNFLTAKKGYNIDYIYYALKNKSFKKFVVGSGIPHIYFKDYKHESIYVSEKNTEINAIVKILNTYDEIITNEKNLLLLLEQKKAYLLKNMFV